MDDLLTEFPALYGLFHFNSTFNIGYCAVLNSGSTQILSMLSDLGPLTTVRNATDNPDQSMWVFSFVKNPYDRALLTWNEANVDLIVDPTAKAAQFYADMLVVGNNTRGGGANDGNYRSQFELLNDTLGDEKTGGRKANFIGRVETFAVDIITVEDQLNVPLNESRYYDHGGESVLVDKDTVFADTTYDSYLTYADAYSSQITKTLIYNTYRADFDTFSYAQ